ncbi:MAG: methylenetetrahydrofolate reductase [Dehalococcoidia bacterium]|nr:methylenetetrahydrofolate reductase [Dehalococcoidia bacterium]
MSTFSERLKTAGFAVTSELNPPKGVELGPLFEEARALSGIVDAINLTDSAGSNMAMAPIAVAHLLTDMGIEPILQITGRDRNRIALGGELLAASALGVVNVLCMTGDPPGRGDHPDAMGVFDLKAESLLDTVTAINSGVDMYGNELSGTPKIFAGAVVNPGADDPDLELSRMEDKIKRGAAFFQTQAVYDAAAFEKFMASAREFGVPVLAGMIVLKSAGMARFLNNQLPGINVPDSIIAEMESATDRAATGVEVTARLIRDVRDMCDGAHIMAIGWESRIPAILESAGLA